MSVYLADMEPFLNGDVWSNILCPFSPSQTLPPLVDAIPEARLNLVIFHLRTEDYDAAYDLVKDMEPSNPQVSLGPVGWITWVIE